MIERYTAGIVSDIIKFFFFNLHALLMAIDYSTVMSILCKTFLRENAKTTSEVW